MMPPQSPLVLAVDMGYGHLRAAVPLAEALGTEVLYADQPPLADGEEQREWVRTRRFYEITTRLSQLPGVGAPLRLLLDGVTHIPHLHPSRDLSAPSAGARGLERLVRNGLGRGLARQLQDSGVPMVSTFYAPAIAADRLGCKNIYCVVTDTDINRVWAPFDPKNSAIHYLVPSRRAGRRLQAYGVRKSHITFTGFPLPHGLVGGPSLAALRNNLAARLVRLDPDGAFRETISPEVEHFLGPLPESERGRPPRVVFAVGGTGAQAGLAHDFLASLRPAIDRGTIALTLVAGVRPEVSALFREALSKAGFGSAPGSGVEILEATDHRSYFAKFTELMARTDVLWTKPSELTFYGALGIPLICSRPVGIHEWYNRRWAIEHGAGLRQRDARFAADWISEWLSDGTLAAAAWSGFARMPKFGLYRILDLLRGSMRSASTPPHAGLRSLDGLLRRAGAGNAAASPEEPVGSGADEIPAEGNVKTG
jgi:hypothetical protein